MNAREPRYRHSRPAVEDRGSLLDRLLWSNEYHDVITRGLVALCGVLATVVVVYQVSLAIARGTQAVVP